MKLHDVINNFKDTQTWTQGLTDLEELLQQLRMDLTTSDFYWSENSTIEQREEFENRFHYAWIRKHYCTDSWVGFKVYWFDDVLIGYSDQAGRKSSLDMSLFKSAEPTLKIIQQEILNLVAQKEFYMEDDFEDEDLGKGYKVEYSEELLADKVYRDDTDEELLVISKHHDYYGSSAEWRLIGVKDTSGAEYKISTNDVYIPWGT